MGNIKDYLEGERELDEVEEQEQPKGRRGEPIETALERLGSKIKAGLQVSKGVRNIREPEVVLNVVHVLFDFEGVTYNLHGFHISTREKFVFYDLILSEDTSTTDKKPMEVDELDRRRIKMPDDAKGVSLIVQDMIEYNLV